MNNDYCENDNECSSKYCNNGTCSFYCNGPNDNEGMESVFFLFLLLLIIIISIILCVITYYCCKI